MHAEGLFEGRRSLPAESLFYAFYDRMGENLPFMAMVRAAPLFVRGWDVDAMRRAGELAARELADLRPALRADGSRRAPCCKQGAGARHDDPGRPRHAIRGARRFRRDRRHALCAQGRALQRVHRRGVRWGPGKLTAVKQWSKGHGVDLTKSHAYSDSVYDIPLLQSVGHPHAVNPDRRLRALATLRRWPVEHRDRPPGVPKIAGFELFHLLRPIVRPQFVPYCTFRYRRRRQRASSGSHAARIQPSQLLRRDGPCDAGRQMGRPVRFLAKRELFDAPVIGQVARTLGGICVDRGSGSQEPLRAARRALEAGEVVVVLPQGTIPRGRKFFDPVLKGKTGTARLAAMTGAPVIPVGLWGTEHVPGRDRLACPT